MDFLSAYSQFQFERRFLPIWNTLNTVLHLTELSMKVVEYAQEDELEPFLEEFNLGPPLTPSQRKLILRYGSAFVARFLDGIEMGDRAPARRSKYSVKTRFENFCQAIREHVESILWYRMGLYGYDTPQVGMFYQDGIFPPLPADIVGKLKDGRFFYYKDGHPHLYGHSGGTHDKWYYFTANTLKKLVCMMDTHDLRAFSAHDKLWKPLELERCQCSHCFMMWLNLPALHQLYPRPSPAFATWRTPPLTIAPFNPVICPGRSSRCCFLCEMLERNEFGLIAEALDRGVDSGPVVNKAQQVVSRTRRGAPDSAYVLLKYVDDFKLRLVNKLAKVNFPHVIALVVAAFIVGGEADALLRTINHLLNFDFLT